MPCATGHHTCNRTRYSHIIIVAYYLPTGRPVIVQFKVWNSDGNNTIGSGNTTIGSGNNTIGGVYNTSGGSLEMLCAARGYPMPLVTLKKEYRSQLTEIASSFQNVTYSIKDLKPSDSGRYICIAYNVADTVTKEVLVTIKSGKLFAYVVCDVFVLSLYPHLQSYIAICCFLYRKASISKPIFETIAL